MKAVLLTAGRSSRLRRLDLRAVDVGRRDCAELDTSADLAAVERALARRVAS